jgi:hypothetical protein
LTPAAGLLAVAELVDRIGVIEVLDEAVGPIKQRARGVSAGVTPTARDRGRA